MRPSYAWRTVALLAAAALVFLGTMRLEEASPGEAPPDGSSQVALEVVDPEGRVRFSGSIAWPEGTKTVLDVLEAAAARHNFTVRTDPRYGDAFVIQIFEFENEGACGWVYTVDGVRENLSADVKRVGGTQRVAWSWGCGF